MHAVKWCLISTFLNYLRLFDESKVQHESEKMKLTEEISVLKETIQKTDIECQNLRLKMSEQKSIIESQKEKLG